MLSLRGTDGASPLRCALAALSAGAIALSLPPHENAALAWVALVPLFVAVVGAGPGSGFLLGLVFGTCASILVAPWFPAMLDGYFGLPDRASLPLAIASSALLVGGPFAVFTGWLGWATRRGPVSPFQVGAGVWLFELARSQIQPFALIASSQLSGPFVQIVPFVGPFALAGGIGAANAAIAGLLVPTLRGPTPLRTAGLLAATGLACLSLAYRPATNERMDRAITVGALQTRSSGVMPIGADGSPLPVLLAATERAAAQGAELVLWPELALDTPLERAGAARHAIAGISRDRELDIVLGSRGLTSARRPTNSLFLVRRGAWSDRYDKVRLVPFSEHLPWRQDVGYAPGRETRVMHAGGAPVGFAICSEAMFPAHARTLVRGGAELLASPSDDRWFPTAGAREQQLANVRLRAVETRRWVVRSVHEGESVAIDPLGRVAARLSDDEAGVLVVTLPRLQGESWYVRVGDGFALVPVLLLLRDAWSRARRKGAP